jgi:hypothetical protein
MADLTPSLSTGAPSSGPSGPRGRPSKARGQPNSSDAANARWTIRGVSPKVREIALRAADGRGMTVGDWVAEAIIQMVRRGETTAAPNSSNLPATDAPPDLSKMIARLDERLARLEAQQKQTFMDRLLAIVQRHSFGKTTDRPGVGPP